MDTFSTRSGDSLTPTTWVAKCLLVGLSLCVLHAASAGAAAYTQSGGTVTKTGQAYAASSTDESGVLVTNSGTFNLSSSTVTTTGNTSSADNSSFLGQNAGVLAKSGAAINLTNCTVDTTGRGANGVFAYGTGSIAMTGGSIHCTGQLAHGIMASGGGTLRADNVTMETHGANSAAIATDRGGGALTVNGGTMNTTGQDSPGIYSTGAITVTGANIAASNSEGAVMEGKNSIVLTDTDLSGGQSNYGAVLLMQSMSGDADVGTAEFSMDGGSLTAPTGSLFFITNNSATIYMTGVTASATSGTLLTACGTSRWGTTGSNGGDVTLTADDQTLSGDISVDLISTLAITLQNGSALTGAIDSAHTSGSVTLTLDATSTWTVTDDSYVNGLSDNASVTTASVANIIGNGHNVYYDASDSANTYLDGKSYTLVNGGVLAPSSGDSGEGEGEGEGGNTRPGCHAGSTSSGGTRSAGDGLALALVVLALILLSRQPKEEDAL